MFGRCFRQFIKVFAVQNFSYSSLINKPHLVQQCFDVWSFRSFTAYHCVISCKTEKGKKDNNIHYNVTLISIYLALGVLIRLKTSFYESHCRFRILLNAINREFEGMKTQNLSLSFSWLLPSDTDVNEMSDGEKQ